MSDTFTNETGCEVSRSHMTGDIVCQRPGPDCDCLIVAVSDVGGGMVETDRETEQRRHDDAHRNHNAAVAARLDEQEQDEAAARRKMFRSFGWSVTDPKSGH